MDKKLVFLISIFFLTFGTFISIVVFQGGNTPLTKATNTIQHIPDLNNTLIFSVPSNNGCNLSVVVNDSNNRAIKNINVCYQTDNGNLDNQCGKTNDSGIYTASLTTLVDNARINATINGQSLSKSVSCQIDK